MTHSTSFSVVQLGDYPGTRTLGQDGHARLDDLLGEREEVDLTIDFAGVKVMNNSFADEFLAKFLISQNFSAKGITVKVTGLTPENLDSVVVCVERRATQVVVLEEDGSLDLVGDDKILADTFNQALKLGSFKANDLADAMGLTAQNANNRLKRLADAGALRKAQVTGSTRGGREFVYETLPAEVLDSNNLTPA